MVDPTPLTEEQARERATRAMWSVGTGLAEADFDSLTVDQQFANRHESDSAFDAARDFYSERERALVKALDDARTRINQLGQRPPQARMIARSAIAEIDDARAALEATEQGTKPASTDRDVDDAKPMA